MPTTALAHLVDDDDAIRDALAWLLQSRHIACRVYASGEAFLAAVGPQTRGCVVLDIRMQGMSGPELFETLQARGIHLPVLFLTGHGDVPMAVAALKKGAFDFLEKPCDDGQLLARIQEALAEDARRHAARTAADHLAARLERLTGREKDVMRLMLAGKTNKAIADELAISMRTVEVHRARLLEKMAVRNAVELARRLQDENA